MAGGIPCTFLAARYGQWAPVVLAAVVFVALVPAGAATHQRGPLD
jgi:hypothetical protein